MKIGRLLTVLIILWEWVLPINERIARGQSNSNGSEPNSFTASPPKASLRCILHTGGSSATFGDGFREAHGFYMPPEWKISNKSLTNKVDMLYSMDKKNIVMMVLEYGPIYSSTNSGLTWTVTKQAGRYEYPIVSGKGGGGFSAVATLYRSIDDQASTLASTNGQHLITTASDGSKMVITIDPLNPAPVLNITRINKNIIVSWPICSDEYYLQENHDLTAPSWVNVTNVAEKAGEEYQVIISSPSSRGFYRLKSR